jgi:predicted transcriptional regulator
MSLQGSLQSDATDALDRQILHSLQLAPRASFRRIADAVGTSEQTVARRHRRLRSTSIVRVVATMGSGQVVTSWMMRIQCRPSAVRAMAELSNHGMDAIPVMSTQGACAKRM